MRAIWALAIRHPLFVTPPISIGESGQSNLHVLRVDYAYVACTTGLAIAFTSFVEAYTFPSLAARYYNIKWAA